MSATELERLEEYFGNKQRELCRLRKVLFGGYHQGSVLELFSQMEQEYEGAMARAEKEYEAQLQALRSRNEALIQENQGYGACLEQIYESLSSLSQSFLSLLEQQRQRDEELKKGVAQTDVLGAAAAQEIRQADGLEERRTGRVITPKFGSSS